MDNEANTSEKMFTITPYQNPFDYWIGDGRRNFGVYHFVLGKDQVFTARPKCFGNYNPDDRSSVSAMTFFQFFVYAMAAHPKKFKFPMFAGARRGGYNNGGGGGNGGGQGNAQQNGDGDDNDYENVEPLPVPIPQPEVNRNVAAPADDDAAFDEIIEENNRLNRDQTVRDANGVPIPPNQELLKKQLEAMERNLYFDNPLISHDMSGVGGDQAVQPAIVAPIVAAELIAQPVLAAPLVDVVRPPPAPNAHVFQQITTTLIREKYGDLYEVSEGDNQINLDGEVTQSELSSSSSAIQSAPNSPPSGRSPVLLPTVVSHDLEEREEEEEESLPLLAPTPTPLPAQPPQQEAPQQEEQQQQQQQQQQQVPAVVKLRRPFFSQKTIPRFGAFLTFLTKKISTDQGFIESERFNDENIVGYLLTVVIFDKNWNFGERIVKALRRNNSYGKRKTKKMKAVDKRHRLHRKVQNLDKFAHLAKMYTGNETFQLHAYDVNHNAPNKETSALHPSRIFTKAIAIRKMRELGTNPVFFNNDDPEHIDNWSHNGILGSLVFPEAKNTYLLKADQFNTKNLHNFPFPFDNERQYRCNQDTAYLFSLVPSVTDDGEIIKHNSWRQRSTTVNDGGANATGGAENTHPRHQDTVDDDLDRYEKLGMFGTRHQTLANETRRNQHPDLFLEYYRSNARGIVKLSKFYVKAIRTPYARLSETERNDRLAFYHDILEKVQNCGLQTSIRDMGKPLTDRVPPPKAYVEAESWFQSQPSKPHYRLVNCFTDKLTVYGNYLLKHLISHQVQMGLQDGTNIVMRQIEIHLRSAYLPRIDGSVMTQHGLLSSGAGGGKSYLIQQYAKMAIPNTVQFSGGSSTLAGAMGTPSSERIQELAHEAATVLVPKIGQTNKSAREMDMMSMYLNRLSEGAMYYRTLVDDPETGGKKLIDISAEKTNSSLSLTNPTPYDDTRHPIRDRVTNYSLPVNDNTGTRIPLKGIVGGHSIDHQDDQAKWIELKQLEQYILMKYWQMVHYFYIPPPDISLFNDLNIVAMLTLANFFPDIYSSFRRITPLKPRAYSEVASYAIHLALFSPLSPFRQLYVNQRNGKRFYRFESFQVEHLKEVAKYAYSNLEISIHVISSAISEIIDADAYRILLRIVQIFYQSSNSQSRKNVTTNGSGIGMNNNAKVISYPVKNTPILPAVRPTVRPGATTNQSPVTLTPSPSKRVGELPFTDDASQPTTKRTLILEDFCFRNQSKVIALMEINGGNPNAAFADRNINPATNISIYAKQRNGSLDESVNEARVVMMGGVDGGSSTVHAPIQNSTSSTPKTWEQCEMICAIGYPKVNSYRPRAKRPFRDENQNIVVNVIPQSDQVETVESRLKAERRRLASLYVCQVLETKDDTSVERELFDQLSKNGKARMESEGGGGGGGGTTHLNANVTGNKNRKKRGKISVQSMLHDLDMKQEYMVKDDQPEQFVNLNYVQIRGNLTMAVDTIVKQNHSRAMTVDMVKEKLRKLEKMNIVTPIIPLVHSDIYTKVRGMSELLRNVRNTPLFLQFQKAEIPIIIQDENQDCFYIAVAYLCNSPKFILNTVIDRMCYNKTRECTVVLGIPFKKYSSILKTLKIGPKLGYQLSIPQTAYTSKSESGMSFNNATAIEIDDGESEANDDDGRENNYVLVDENDDDAADDDLGANSIFGGGGGGASDQVNPVTDYFDEDIEEVHFKNYFRLNYSRELVDDDEMMKRSPRGIEHQLFGPNGYYRKKRTMKNLTTDNYPEDYMTDSKAARQMTSCGSNRRNKSVIPAPIVGEQTGGTILNTLQERRQTSAIEEVSTIANVPVTVSQQQSLPFGRPIMNDPDDYYAGQQDVDTQEFPLINKRAGFEKFKNPSKRRRKEVNKNYT